MRFFRKKEGHLFRSVAREVLDKSSVLVDLYLPVVLGVTEATDEMILYGDVPTGRHSYVRIRDIPVVFSDVFDYDYAESEQGLSESANLEVYTLKSVLDEKIGNREVSFVGAIIRYGDMYFEVVDDDLVSYVFNEPSSALVVRFSVMATTKVPSDVKVSQS